MEEQEKKKRSKTRFLWRGLAVVMALVMIVELGIPSVTRVSFSETQYQEVLAQRAAQLLAAQEEYLHQSKLEQGATYMRSRTTADNYNTFASKASVAIGQEKYAEAAEYLGECIKYYRGDKDEELAMLHLKRAGLYILSGDHGKAAAELDKTLDLQPKNTDALYLRIQISLEKEDLAAAARDALTYEGLTEADEESLAAFAGIYEAAGDADNALRCYAKLIDERKAGKPEYYAARAALRVRKEDVAGAREDLENFFLENGKDEKGEKALLLCGCYLQEGKPEAAKAAYDSALENGAEPGTEMKNWMAAACLSLEQYEEAEKLLDEVTAAEPEYKGAAYLKGLCLYALEKYEDAEKSFSRSLELEQESLNSLYYRGICRLQLERLEDAVTDFEQVVALGGDSDQVKSAAEILAAMKDN